jgi:2-polyprenyl-6-hydroxyphenyl methylase/3-demethylubiquinone-9 3-methyltransferase
MQNVDAQELAKFSDLAHRWWDPDSEFRPLHQINPLRLAWIDELAGLRGKTVLDVGCGGGILAESMARKALHVTGIDLAAKPLGVARLHALEAGVTTSTTARSPPSRWPPRSPRLRRGDLHGNARARARPGAVVQACKTLVKPGGWVFFSTLNRNPKAFLFAIIGAEYLLRMLPKGTHEYERFIRPSELARWCRDAGLAAAGQPRLEYNPFTRRYRLSGDTSVNYLVACRRPA